MTPREALKIVDAAFEISKTETVKTPELRAALDTLMRFGRGRRNRDGGPMEPWPMEWFWDCADSDNDIGRHQNLMAAWRGILRQLNLPDE